MRDRAVVWSVAALVVVTVISMVVGFVWLPAAHGDFTAKGLWDGICRAAGVPANWGTGEAAPAAVRTTAVVFEPAMTRPGAADAVGRGATLALQCTMCHSPRGAGDGSAPNLAGQYPEVVIKQLRDYQRGDRTSAIMQALAGRMSARDIDDLAAYYAQLARPKNTPVTDMGTVPPLVKVGDPMRNIAPCASCHGGMEQKLGTPWLEGMPKAYLTQQLKQFATGERRNDSHAQMRNMARALTPKEIEEVSDFYARAAGE